MAILFLSSAAAQSQPQTPAAGVAAATQLHWQQCNQLSHDAQARLACYDQWAAQQAEPTEDSTPVPAPPTNWGTAAKASEQPTQGLTAPSENYPSDIERAALAAEQGKTVVVASNDGCRNPAFDETARFWELSNETDCGNFRFRGYRPITVSVVTADHVNREPYTPAHGFANYQDYRNTEARLQLSVRTKLASNILTGGSAKRRDSLWFGYTQQSYWQLFTPDLSRPFRNTDHEPELVYIYPVEWRLFGSQAKLRYAGLGINHQSNGQSDPISRSWNRYFMTFGLDVTPNLRTSAKIWKRVNEGLDKDDNPRISDYIGRAELQTVWDINPTHTLALTVRHSLGHSARGSTRLEWYRTLGTGFAGGKSNLRLHTSIFSGYGDSLIDYNFRRNVFSIGFSLLDF